MDAKLYFYYGAMGSSKTAQALMTRFNYEEKGQKALLTKPKTDTRDGDNKIKSRVGLEHTCEYLEDIENMTDEQLLDYDVIIVDEAQFISKKDVEKLVYIVDVLNIPVICYGLLSDFKGELFEGSRELIVMADKRIEMKTMCWCGRKASFNARFNSNGEIVRSGEQIVMGANDKYTSVCRKHWMVGELGLNKTIEDKNK